MPDREMVIKGLRDIDGFIAGRIGFSQAKNFLRTIDEAIVLLKEQEPLAVRMIDDDNLGAIKFGCCPTCNAIINNRGYPKSCGCGQAVKWDADGS